MTEYLKYSRKSYDIVAYTYNAAIYCPSCVLAAMNLTGESESALDNAAIERGVDRYDEWSFDSGSFPKVVFADQLEDQYNDETDTWEADTCGECGEEL